MLALETLLELRVKLIRLIIRQHLTLSLTFKLEYNNIIIFIVIISPFFILQMLTKVRLCNRAISCLSDEFLWKIVRVSSLIITDSKRFLLLVCTWICVTIKLFNLVIRIVLWIQLVLMCWYVNCTYEILVSKNRILKRNKL